MDEVWRERLLERLSQADMLGAEAVRYIRDNKVQMRFRKRSKSIGARWFFFRSISLNSRYYSIESNLDDSKLLSLLVHEVHHLKQGLRVALSVYGELDAWQVEYRFYKRIHPGKLHAAIEELLTLPLNYERDNLRRAVKLMQSYAGKGYHADWLPLRPLGYWFMSKYRDQENVK